MKLSVTAGGFALYKESDIIGQCSVTPAPKGADIASLSVLPQWRRKGYGSYLLKEILRRFGGYDREGATVFTAPGRLAVHPPIASMNPIPCPASQRKGAPRPTGSSKAPSARAGMIRKSDSGAVARLASRPYMAVRLKCCMAKGPVASPATRLAVTAAVNQPPKR